MKIKFKKWGLCMLMVTMVAFLMLACGTDAEFTPPKIQSENNQNQVESAESTQVPTTEPEVRNLGEYSLEECKNQGGLFIALGDGSFNVYRGGGYCYGLTSKGQMFYGMFMRDVYLEYAQEIQSNDDKRLVVFSESDYSLTLHPIHGEVTAFSTVSADGIDGFGRISQISDHGAFIDIIYKNHEREDIKPDYIDGSPATAYNATKVKWEYKPFKGMPNKSYQHTLLGFKNTSSVTISMAEGTTLVEKEYNVDATYYHCDYEHNNWQSEDIYHIEGMATPQGYAEVDLSNVPAGKYVILFRCDGKYRANIINIVK